MKSGVGFKNDKDHTSALVCFSHLRWNFVFQRPQQLLSRAVRQFDVYFFEEPLFEDKVAPHLAQSISPEGVQVLVPVLPKALNGPQAIRAQRKLVDQLVKGF